MPPSAPRPARNHLRFAVPSSLGAGVEARAEQLQQYLRGTLGREAEVVVSPTYEGLARDLLMGKIDAAWAPPFVCARIEAMGVRVLVRGLRNGASTYRAALLCRADANVTIDSLNGTSAAWSDRDSVGGYLLAMAYLRERSLNPAKVFLRQDFVGSYRAALEAVAAGKADVTSVFAPSHKAGLGEVTGIGDVWAEATGRFKVLAWTDEAPNDGVAVAMNVAGGVATDLEKALVAMAQSDAGTKVLHDCFNAERFELAPRMGYRALYRVALASL